LLAAQREAMGWTVEQIADQLKLAVRQVKALEAGDYAALPNMAVTRFVRAYAKVLKIDAAPLVAMIEAARPISRGRVAPRKDLAQSFSESRFPSMTGGRRRRPVG
jgi:cytoskeleton protein RodZ